jgi:uncharacterized protein YkwD
MRNRCSEIEKWILIYTNRARKKRNIKPLKSNFGLKKLARSHSHTMANTKKIWHGNGVFKAKSSISKSSLLDFIISLFYYGMSGENVGLMFSGYVKGFKRKIRSDKDIALAQHLSWMRSPGHRNNILNPSFRLIGVGVNNRGNVFYCTQNFYG